MERPKRNTIAVSAATAALAALVLAGCGGRDSAVGANEARQRAELRAQSEAYAGAAVPELMQQPSAARLGRRLFEAWCASCHGDDAAGTGGRNVPNLAAGFLSYGADADAVRTTIAEGRRSVMPPMGRRLGEVDVGQLVAFVETLGADAPLSDYEQRGSMLFAEHCATCHGPEGRGIAAQGTASLRDAHWEHGGTMMNMRLVITRGVEATCPAHGDELTEAEIGLLTAYVLGLVERGARAN